jgi:hypothetical protein
MSSMKETAERFFEACETGKGWDACQTHCHEGATFSSQTGALEGIETVQDYTEWMKGLFTPVPDASYEVRSFAVDDGRRTWPLTAYSEERTPQRVDQCPRPGRSWRPTTCKSWISTVIESVI